MNEVKHVNVPNFDEFAVKKIFPKVVNNQTIMAYIPDLGEGRLVDREYFYDVLATLYPSYVADIIHGAYEKRSGEVDQQEDEVIEITPFLLQSIEDSSFISSKCMWFYKKYKAQKKKDSFTEKDVKSGV